MRNFSLIYISCLLIFVLTACNSGNIDETPLKQKSAQAENTTASSKEGKKTIVFSTFYEEDFIKEAIKTYEAKHPEIEIQLTIAHPDGNDINWDADHEKFVKTTNTQMLTGKGPDILEMDQLPIDQYVNKQVLVNLSEMMAKDAAFQKEQYFNNILDNVKLDGAVYGMPVRFYLYGIIGDEAAIRKTGVAFDDKSWTWNQFIHSAKEMAKQGGHSYAFYGDSINLLNEMVGESYSQFIDQVNRKANFDSVGFIDLMKQMKMMIDDKVVNDQGRSDTFFRMETISSIRNYMLAGTGLQEIYPETKLYNKPKSEGQKPGGFFRTETTLGINANSSVQKEAWEFIKFLISDEVEPGGFPLNKNAYNKQVQQVLQVGSVKADEEGALKGKEFKVTAADMDELEAYLADAIHPVEFKSSKVEDIISEEAKAYFSGQKTAEAVAKLIQNRATLYLNE